MLSKKLIYLMVTVMKTDEMIIRNRITFVGT